MRNAGVVAVTALILFGAGFAPAAAAQVAPGNIPVVTQQLPLVPSAAPGVTLQDNNILVRADTLVMEGALVVSLPSQGDQDQLLLRFQLIQAGMESRRTEPAIAGLDSLLRDLFRFTSYQLLSQAAIATTAGETSSQLLSGGGSSYELIVSVLTPPSAGRGGGGTGAAGQGKTHLRVTLRGWMPPSGSARADAGTQGAGRGQAQTLLNTVVSLAIGSTIVLGSTEPAPGQALILVVRPEIRR